MGGFSGLHWTCPGAAVGSWFLHGTLLVVFLVCFILTKECLLMLERGEERDRQRERKERHIDLWSLTCTPNRDQTYNLGMCHDQDSNP